MKENFPNLAKKIDFQEVQETQRVPKKLDPRRNTPRHIIITLAKMKQKERLPASQERSLERPTWAWGMHRPAHLGTSTRGAQFDGG